MSKSYRHDPEEFNETPTDEFIRRRVERKARSRWDQEFYQHQAAQTSDKRASISPRHMRRQD